MAAGKGEERSGRVAWHLAAARGPDEAVAARLEQAAGQARDRGGYAATVTFLSRAAELSEDEGERARRLLAASEAALTAGQPFRAGALLEEATPHLGDPLARAQARRLQGTIRFARGQAGEAAAILLEAARALAPAHVGGARAALLQALEAALYAGWSANRAILAEIAALARATPAVGGPEATTADLLLDTFVARAAASYPASVPLYRRAVAMLSAGDLSLAEAALGRLAERALAAGTKRALGLLARSRALLAGDADAEPLYQEAIGHLGQCWAKPQLARAYLLYGECLRRQRRRRDAREQLRTAHDMFTSMGIEAFAERARAELLATGERARPRTAPAAEELTPQEAQIARLVGEGESNRDIAAQLFLSPSTVDYHLRKVFRKTGVTSRTQLARTMADGPREPRDDWEALSWSGQPRGG